MRKKLLLCVLALSMLPVNTSYAENKVEIRKEYVTETLRLRVNVDLDLNERYKFELADPSRDNICYIRNFGNRIELPNVRVNKVYILRLLDTSVYSMKEFKFIIQTGDTKPVADDVTIVNYSNKYSLSIKLENKNAIKKEEKKDKKQEKQKPVEITTNKPEVKKEEKQGWNYNNSENYWYYVNQKGNYEKGWLFDNSYNSYFFFNNEGKMQTGWIYDDYYSKWYYFKDNGKWDKNAKYKKVLVVPVLSQLKPYYLPMGCEGTSFTMAIKYKGINNYSQKDINSLFTITGDPRTGFLGSPFSARKVQGTTPTIWPEALVKYLSSVYSNIENISGADLKILEREIDKGNPIVFWIAYKPMRSISTPNGRIYNSRSMHCVTLVGYDDTHFYINDPNTNNRKRVSKSWYYNAYARYGKRAVVVR